MANKKTITTWIIIILVIAITAIGIVVVNKSKDNKKGGMPMMGGGGRYVPSATSVRTVVAENSVLHDYVVTNGEIETQKSIEVFPSIGGKVVEMKVSLGSPVKAGDVIAYIDPSEPGSYYAKSPVTAPISGSIITSPVKTGQKVSMSSVITKIGDIENLQVTAKISERYIGDLHIGQKAEVSLKAYPEDIFYASVVRISPVVDPASRTKEIILNFDKKYEKVNAGMFAKVKLFTLDYEGYPAIKQDAFVNNNDEYYLFVVKPDSKVEKRKVVRGKNVDGYYQVLDGVKPGEVVVVEGMLTLYEGAEVKDISGNVAPATPADSGKKE
jgi:multidrug efflux pump subunit AcrA (membrane-fusion protein)